MSGLETLNYIQIGDTKYTYSDHEKNCILTWFSYGWSQRKISRSLQFPRIVVKHILCSYLETEDLIATGSEPESK